MRHTMALGCLVILYHPLAGVGVGLGGRSLKDYIGLQGEGSG